GFTHFFWLKTVLYAREQEQPAKSYIWLFDEPGVYLHPDGQHDLLKVLETLSSTNQVVYSTHSIFMLDKNHPSRHRLILKDADGTRIESKPYAGRWEPARQALGLNLPGTILFASKVLLVEGDSDPIYMNAILQKTIESGLREFDINPVSILGTGDGRNAEAIARILQESQPRPRIAALFDGDKGGKERMALFLPYAKNHDIECKALTPDGTVLEAVLPLQASFLEAVARYIAKVGDHDVSQTLEQVREAYEKRPEDDLRDIAKWSRHVGVNLGLVEKPVSPVGIAREYVALLDEVPADRIRQELDASPLKELVDWIVRALELPGLILDQADILAR
ncbi:MAG: AAA family ATPase, partial [Dehalococcoidia bacterium]|nr:AAA family ATPase [Dehalococcoidia bacterium]